MPREIESYFDYPSEYDPGKPAAIDDYTHPTRDGNDHTRLPESVLTEIDELVVTSVANWPLARIEPLVSDRANIDKVDVYHSIARLVRSRVIRKNPDIGFSFEYQINEPFSEIDSENELRS